MGRLERQSNIELLRILAMVGIVAHNLVLHGGITFDESAVSPLGLFWIEFLSAWGGVGANIFVLISGYFMSGRRDIKVGKGLSLWTQLLTYSLGTFLVFVVTGMTVPEGTPIDWVRSITPVTSQIWWFASIYLTLFVLSPYLNAMTEAIGRNRGRRLLLAMVVVWCLLPSLIRNAWPGAPLAWYVFLYLLAAHIRRYKLEPQGHGPALLAAGAFSVVMIAVLGEYVTWNRYVFVPLGISDATIWDGSFVLTLFASLCLFMGFLVTDMGKSKAVNMVASVTFGVYLLHDHPWVRRWLWEDLFGHIDVTSMPVARLVLVSVAAILAVFCACGFIEALRQRTVGRLLEKPLVTVTERIERGIREWLPVSDG